MQSVSLKLLYHRGKKCIGIYFARDSALQSILQNKAGAKWSRTKGCWYIEANESAYQKLKIALGHVAVIETNEVKNSLKRDVPATAHKTTEQPFFIREDQPPGKQMKAALRISDVNADALEKYHRELILKGYSPSTIRTYKNEFRQFLSAIKNHPATEFTPDRLKDYLQYCFEKLSLSENTLHSRMNALKFYYEGVLKREKFFWEIPRPKKPRILPKLLGENELRRLFNALENKKHKAMLFTVYSAGLRVSEIVNLKISDIDSDRMQIFIARAKGKKDRYVNLSPILLDILRNYLLEYKPRPKEYLFESEQTFKAYPARTVQQIFSNAKNKAQIKKEVGIHSLRHSFATHLLEKGTDIKYIKDLLGHFNIKTTEIYLHVSREKLVNISSPFDDLWKKGKIVW